ncbi:MAG: phage minor head protein, partial [Aquabacterium sp.]
MPRPAPPGVRLGIVEPQDAVNAFLRRDLLLPSFRWQDVWQQEHLRGFAVAGVMRHDILQLMYDELGVAIQAGATAGAFVKRARQRLAERGFWGNVEVTDPATGEVRTTRFNDGRLRLIHDTNLGQAYAVGQAERFARTKQYLPWLRYSTKGDDQVRESHAAWDNVTLPHDHPWWATHRPMKAWRCRCTVAQLSQRQYERLLAAGKIKTKPPADVMVDQLDPRTGETLRLPRGVDAAFAYDATARPLRSLTPPPLLADPLDRRAAARATTDAGPAMP